MDTTYETQKRLDISRRISSQLEQTARGILLGGSMDYGQNYSVTDKSDIDMIIVCDKDRVKYLARTNYFTNKIPGNVLEMFQKGDINLFWVIQNIDDVEVNSFVYEANDFSDFCQLRGKLVVYIPTQPQETQEAYRFDGSLLTFNRNVRPFNNGFLFEKPSLVKGKFWGGPPRSDFLTGGFILYEKDNFLTDLREDVWNAVIKQMVKEFPNPDLSRVNILNSDFTYQRNKEKLPPQVVSRVQEETKKRLKSITR